MGGIRLKAGGLKVELRAVKTLETKMDKVLGGREIGFRQAKLAGYSGMERMDGLSHSTHSLRAPNKPRGHEDKRRRQALRCKTVMSLTHAPPPPHLTVIARHVGATHAGGAIHKLGVHPL